MARRFLKESHPFIQILFLVFLALLIFLLVSIAGTLLAIPIFNIRLDQLTDMVTHLDDPKILHLMKYLQTLQSVSLFLIPALIFLLIVKSDVLTFPVRSYAPGWILIILVVMIMFFLIPVNNVLLDWNSKLHLPDRLSGVERAIRRMEDNASVLTESFLKMNNFGSFMMNIIIIALLPALGEELMFRGALQPLMISWTRNAHAGIWITGFLFSFFHFQFFGLIPRWVLGVVFGYMFYWGRNIWLPMLAHFVNNGLAVTVYYLYGSVIVEEKVDKLGVSDSGIVALAGVAMTGLLLYLLKVSTRPVHETTEGSSGIHNADPI